MHTTKHSLSTRRKMRLAHLGKKHSKKQRDAIRRGLLGMSSRQKRDWGRKISEAKTGMEYPKENIRRAQRLLRQNPSFLKRLYGSYKNRASKTQISIFKSLCARGVRGLRLEYCVPPYFIDIALPERKIAIEIDGMYWHRLPSQKRKDRNRSRILHRQGWRVYRFSSEAPFLESVMSIKEVLR